MRYNPIIEDPTSGQVIRALPASDYVLHTPNGERIKLTGRVSVRDIQRHCFD